MKAVLLAAGLGKRLKPITYSIPKPMIKLAGEPILEYIIRDLLRSEISDIGIVVGHLKEQIIDHFGDGSKLRINLTYLHQRETKGTANAALIAKNFVAGDPFLLYLADTLIPDGLDFFMRDSEALRADCIVLTSKIPGKQANSAGTVELKNGNVARLAEKSNSPRSSLGIAGVYYFRNDEIFEKIRNLNPGSTGEYEITDAIQEMVSNGFKVKALVTRRRYIDAGSPTGLLRANRFAFQSLGKIDASDSPSRGKVTSQRWVFVGRNCSIGKDCTLGPFVSIDDYVSLGKSCTVRDSIIMNSSKVSANVEVTHSIIGPKCSIINESNKSKKICAFLSEGTVRYQ